MNQAGRGSIMQDQSLDIGYNEPDSPSAGAIRPLLLEYWVIFQRRKVAISAAVALSLAVGTIVTFLTPAEYTARSLIQIDREQKRITNVESLDPESAARDAEFYATQYELLKARSLAERVARRLNLASSDSFFAAHGAQRPTSSGKSTVAGARGASMADFEAATGLLLEHIDVAPVKSSKLVTVSYESRDPNMAASVANAWGQEFIASNLDRQFASTAQARKFLEERLKALRERLEQSEREVVNYATDRDIVKLQAAVDAAGRTTGSQTLTEADLARLNEELNRATAERVSLQGALSSKADSTAAIVASPVISQMRQARATLAAEYAKLLVQFDPEYATARAVKEQIDSLDRAIRDETARIARAQREAFRSAEARESELRRTVNNLKEELRRQQKATIQYNIYQRDADTNRQLYEAILQRYKEIGIAGTVGVNNIAIVDAAEIPKSPSSPKLIINLGISLLAGIGLAFILVLGLEQLDQGLRDPAQVKDVLQLPLVGTVPLDSTAFEQELTDPKSQVYEAYFATASNLALSTAHGFPRSLMVTSSQPSEGKTSSSIVFAVILGRLGKRVLLMDADLRSPSLANRLGVTAELGLSNYLTGADDWQAFVVPTRFQNVFLLASGPVPPNAPELLSSDRLQKIVASAHPEFDHVLIDAPPVLGLADAPLISKAVEGSVFVVEAKRVPLQVVRDGINRLRTVRSPIIGGLVTKLSARDGRYGYGYGYGAYGYGYGYGHDYGKNRKGEPGGK
jgi:capsular exopolysaccharide synthesis family protein